MIETSKSGANLNDDEIKEEVDTIMFEVRIDVQIFTNCLRIFRNGKIHSDVLTNLWMPTH